MKEEEKGFNLVCGTSLDKNGINGVKPGIRWSIGEESDRMLDISKFNSLLVADLDYFIEHHDEIVEMIKERIKHRDNSGSTLNAFRYSLILVCCSTVILRRGSSEK